MCGHPIDSIQATKLHPKGDLLMPRVQYQGRDVEATLVDFVIGREDWNEYQLHDGTVLRLRVVVSEVFRLHGEWDAEGNPVYIVKSGNVLVVRAAENLKRK